MAYLLTSLLIASLGAWIFGRRQQAVLAGRASSWSAAATTVTAAVAIALAVGVPDMRHEAETTTATDAWGVQWEPWTAERVESLRKDDRLVFLDFTAAWCLTCKVNENVTFSSAEVRQRLRDLDVATLKADWTNGDPAITKALESFGRSGVPLYVLYNGMDEPVVLPQVLNPGVFLDALAAVDDNSPQQLAARH